MSVRRDLRMVPVAAAVWGSAAVVTTMPETAPVAGIGLWAGAVTVVVAAAISARRARSDRRRRRWQTVLVLAAIALSMAAATASNAVLAQPARSAAASVAVGGGRALTAHVTVTGKANPGAAGDVAFDGQLHQIDTGATSYPVDAAVRVRASTDAIGRLGSVDIGDDVIASGTAFPARAGERAVLILRASRGLQIARHADGVLAVAAALRHGLAVASHGLPEPGASLIPGLAVGDTTAVGVDLDAAMKASSLSHLTAVSGANCAIVVGLAFAAAAACGLRRGVRVAIALAALAGFVILVSPEPSVVRAAAMAAMAMLGVQLGRIGSGVSLLAVAVVACLVADPWLATSLGFALSVAATGGLLLLARPLARGLQRGMPRALALAISIPLSAQVACGPLLILVNPTVPLYGVVANLLAEPAAPLATMAGLAACIALPVPVLQAGLAALTWLPAAWIAGVATVTSALPAHGLPWLDGLLGAVALALWGAGVVVLIVPPRSEPPRRAGFGRRSRRVSRRAARADPTVEARRRPRVPHGVGLRALAAAGVAAVVGIWAGSAALGSVAAPLTVPAGWSIALCDVGQGDGILLRSAGKVALIDTGPDPGPLQTCLRRMGIERIDLLVLTHFDHDHAGAADAVADRVGTVLHGPFGSAQHERLVQRLVSAGAAAVQASAGMTGALGDARWTVLWPPPQSRAYPPGNEACIVLDVRGGAVPASLFLCDTDALVQRALVRSGALRPPYRVVKVAHHGSADQDPALYRQLGARLALVSVGAHNDYGHPRATTLAFLEADGMTVARTDREGMVAVVATGDSLGVWRERSPP
jgi:competence protein ComEC